MPRIDRQRRQRSRWRPRPTRRPHPHFPLSARTGSRSSPARRSPGEAPRDDTACCRASVIDPRRSRRAPSERAPELRAVYDVGLLRKVMFVAMVTSGAISILNVLVRRVSWLSASAFILLVLTELLGGPAVPVADFPDHTPSRRHTERAADRCSHPARLIERAARFMETTARDVDTRPRLFHTPGHRPRDAFAPSSVASRDPWPPSPASPASAASVASVASPAASEGRPWPRGPTKFHTSSSPPSRVGADAGGASRAITRLEWFVGRSVVESIPSLRRRHEPHWRTIEPKDHPSSSDWLHSTACHTDS